MENKDDIIDRIFINGIRLLVYVTMGLAVVGLISLINIIGGWIW